MLLKQGMLLGLDQVMRHHLGTHFFCCDFGHPTELLFGVGGIAEQGFDFCGPEVVGVYADECDFWGRGLTRFARNVGGGGCGGGHFSDGFSAFLLSISDFNIEISTLSASYSSILRLKKTLVSAAFLAIPLGVSR